MVSVFDPVVLLTVGWLVVLFAAVWRSQWGDLPPTRATFVVGCGLLWLAYSFIQLAEFLAPPYDDALVAGAAVSFVAGGSLFWRWLRQR